MKGCGAFTTETRLKKEKHHVMHDEEDRISQLPEPILLKILSLVPTKDALKSSVLSTTWNSVSRSFSVFDLDQTYFRGSESDEALYKDFAYYVNNTISRRTTVNNSIQKFKLLVRVRHSDLRSRLNADLDRWLDYAVSNNVKNLVLHYYDLTKGMPAHALPMSSPLYRVNNKFLKELDLFHLKFVGSSSVGIDQIGFSLKKLTLERVDIDNHALQSLLSNCCSSLEELSIRYCSGFQSVNISSAKLQILDLYPRILEDQKIAIEEAPDLRFLRYTGHSKNIQASLETSNFNNNIVRELTFDSVVTISAATMRFIVREFRVLQKLHFYSCALGDDIQISSYNRFSDLDMTSESKNVDRLIANCSRCYYHRNNRRTPEGLCKLELALELDSANGQNSC